MRCDQGGEGARAGPGHHPGRSGAVGVGEEGGDLGLQRVGLAGVGAARVRGGPHRAPPEGILGRPAALREPVTLEKTRVVELLDERGDLLDGGCLAVAASQDLADHVDRMLAVEERDQVEQRSG